jgi:phosphoribosylformylglycinamidine synthase
MEPWEILLSESQERMLFVLNKDAGEDVFAIFKKWDLDCQKIGELVEGRSFVVSSNDNTYCDIPLQALEPPVLDRDTKPRTSTIHTNLVTDKDEYSVVGFRKQFDQEVMGNTVFGIHNDFGIIKLPHSNKGVAIATASYPYLCSFNPSEGIVYSITSILGKFRKHNVIPMALTNCLNFGNPEDPYVMYDFVDTIINLDKAARYWDLPIVSGNVSLYNETAGQSIMPTPVIGCIGLVKDIYDV